MCLTYAQNRRQLKQSALVTLNVLLQQQASVSLKCCTMILDQLAPLISEEDLHLSHLTLVLITTILGANVECAKTLKRGAFKSVLRLLESKVLQGLALEVRRLLQVPASAYLRPSVAAWPLEEDREAACEWVWV